jgi:hypothetical protein
MRVPSLWVDHSAEHTAFVSPWAFRDEHRQHDKMHVKLESNPSTDGCDRLCQFSSFLFLGFSCDARLGV